MTNLTNSPQSRDLLDIFVSIAQIVGSLGTAGALLVTYRTLIELKRQTDLSNNPILKIRYRFFDSLEKQKSTVLFNELDSIPFNSWQHAISNNLHQDLSNLQNTFLCIVLTNSGKSEITYIRFLLSLDVSMFENDVLDYKIQPTAHNWAKEFQTELGENDSVIVPIVNVKYFPIYKVNISELIFRDIRGNKYSNFDGDPQIQKTNITLKPIQPSEEELSPPPESDEFPF